MPLTDSCGKYFSEKMYYHPNKYSTAQITGLLLIVYWCLWPVNVCTGGIIIYKIGNPNDAGESWNKDIHFESGIRLLMFPAFKTFPSFGYYWNVLDYDPVEMIILFYRDSWVRIFCLVIVTHWEPVPDQFIIIFYLVAAASSAIILIHLENNSFGTFVLLTSIKNNFIKELVITNKVC